MSIILNLTIKKTLSRQYFTDMREQRGGGGSEQNEEEE